MATGQLSQGGREVLRGDQLLAQAGATVVGNIGEPPQAIEELGALLGWDAFSSEPIKHIEHATHLLQREAEWLHILDQAKLLDIPVRV
jgi:hypothetical protein